MMDQGPKPVLRPLLWERLAPQEHVGLAVQVTAETQALGLPSQSSELSDWPGQLRDSSHIL